MMYLKALNASIGLLFLLVLVSPRPAQAENEKHYRGVFSEIFYTADEDLRNVDRRVNISWLRDKPKDIKELSLPGVVASKFDAIRMNVERILDMYPRDSITRFNIVKDRAAIEKVLAEKYSSDKAYKAFYSKSDRHIYLAANLVDTNIVAHEVAHAVVDHELGSAVPETVHEILARYVDAHLYD